MVQQHFIQSTQLSQEERIEIYRHHAQGLSCRKIWKMLGRHHTSISREIARNSTDYWWWKTIYKPIEAERKKQERKRKANDEHIKLKKNNKPMFRGRMRPDPSISHHPAFATLWRYATEGCPVDCGAPWTREHIEAAIHRGPHISAKTPEAAACLRQEALEKVEQGYRASFAGMI